MIFGLCVETLSSLLIFIFSCIYDAKGLTETRTLTIVHILSLLIQAVLNYAVMTQFKSCFNQSSETKELHDDSANKSGSSRESSEHS